MTITVVTIGIIVIFVLAIFSSAVRILREYERGVIFTLGRYTGTKGPGFVLLVPLVQQMVRVDLRIVVNEVPSQDVISRDNVSVKVSAVIYFRVIDAERAVIQVTTYMEATSQLRPRCVPYWASTTSMRCSPRETSSTSTSKMCSTNRLMPGVSRSPTLRSSASTSMTA
jgi:hypothetical protein